EASKIGFVSDKQIPYRRLIKLLLEAKQSAAAFEYAERSKARALVDMLAAKQDFSVAAIPTDEVRRLLAMQQQAEMDTRGNDASDAQRARNLVVSINNKIAQAAPDLAAVTSVTF